MRAQELGLSGRAELSDFIEEKRARVRLRELAGFGSISAGKRAALIAETVRSREAIRESQRNSPTRGGRRAR